MAEAWPVALQQLLNVDNFAVVFGDTLLRSDMDVGLDKVRSRYTSAVDVYSSSIDLDMDDFDTLRDFYKTALSNGSKTFLFVNPLNEETEEFRFIEPPGITPIGGRIFRVNMKWERIPT
jgi:hypothetical protein